MNIINGRDYKEVVAVDGIYPICGSGGEIGRASDYLCPANTVIIGRKGNINKPLFIEERFWNIDTAFGLVAKDEYLFPKFLFYFCLHYDFERHNKAVTIPSLTKADLLKINMLLPSVADQQQIVAELDCLNEMIAVKQEQLKEFDKLALSIFHDMFLNDDNALFERVELKECVKEMHLGPFGSSLKNEFFVPKEAGYCMVYEQQHAIKKTMDLPTRYVDEGKYRELERFEVGPGDILMSCRGTIGEIFIIPDDAPKGIIHPSLMKIRLNPVYIEKTYFLYLLSHIKDNDSNGATIKMAITAKELGKERISLPSLSLQQQFAEKISAIEAQKELVKQSIAETQLLLNYTMDKYFE